MKYSACIEMLFVSEASVLADRIHLAARAGLSAVEFWTWRDKDIPAIEAALSEAGIALAGFVAEPMIALTDPENRQAFLDGVSESADLARRLGARTLIAQAGNLLDHLPRAAQRDSLVRTLDAAGALLEGTGIRLGVEPLNTLVDHQGYFLSSTAEGLDIADDIDRPEIGIVYDVYHSAVMGETTADVIGDRIGRVIHVHVADHPGRHEPGSGNVDLRQRVAWLAERGYAGPIGLEFRPTGSTTEALAQTMAALG